MTRNKKRGYETEPELRASVSARLIALRAHKRAKPKYIEDSTGIPRSSYRGYEQGILPTMLRIIQLAAFYGVSIDFLLTGEGSGKIPVVYFNRMAPPELRAPVADSHSVDTTDLLLREEVAAKQAVKVTRRKATSKKHGRGEMDFKFDLSE